MTDKPYDMHALWRLIIWGGCAALAVGGVVLVGETDGGSRRLQAALSAATATADRTKAVVVLTPQTSRVPDRRTVALENETRRLGDLVLALAADRDRLAGRVASLESSVADMTGSIKDMTSVAKKEPREASPPPQSVSIPAPQPAPVASAPAVTPPQTAPMTSASPANAALPAVFLPVAIDPVEAEFPDPPRQTARLAPLPDATAPALPKPKPGIGIDIGGATTIEALRGLWAALKANHGPLFAGLQPFVTTQVARSGKQELRLVLGPMPNSATAGRYCTMLSAAHILCRPAVYDGPRLALQ